MTDRRTATVFMRGGTYNALIFHVDDLPPAGPERDQLFCRAMGSPDPYGRQLDGLAVVFHRSRRFCFYRRQAGLTSILITLSDRLKLPFSGLITPLTAAT